jgi:hypothetical protein
MANEDMELNAKYTLWQEEMDTTDKTLIGFSKNLPVGKTGAERLNICNNIPTWVEEDEKIAYLTYGRYQPGHIGHRSLFEAMVLEADPSFTHSTVETKAEKKSIGIKTNIFVFVSPTGGEEWGKQHPAGRAKNPLDPAAKVDLLFDQNEDLPLFIINTKLMPGVQSIVGAIRLLLVCYDKVKVRLGDEDVEGFKWLKKVFGDKIVDITSSSSKPRSDDDRVASMSASKIRAHAKLFEEIRDEHWNFIVGALRPDGADVSNDDIIEIIERIKFSDKIGGKRKTKRRTKRKSKRRTKRKTKRRTKRRTKRKKKKTKRRVKKRKRTKRR